MTFVNRIRKQALTDEELMDIREREAQFIQQRFSGSQLDKSQIDEDEKYREKLTLLKLKAEPLLSDEVDLNTNVNVLKEHLGEGCKITGTAQDDGDVIVIEVEEGKVLFRITPPDMI